MTQEHEDFIVSKMPAEKQTGVRARIAAAVKAGWTGIGIWDAWEKNSEGEHHPLPPDDDDLFGIPPGEKSGCKPIP